MWEILQAYTVLGDLRAEPVLSGVHDFSGLEGKSYRQM